MRPVVIFDIDKTFLKVDLPAYLFENRIFKRKIGIKDIFYTTIFCIIFHCTRWKIRRRFEYWYERMIDTQRVCEIIIERNLINAGLRRRVERYLRLNYEIYFITAAPQSLSENLCYLYHIQVIGSKTFNGFINNDLMGVKECKVYQKIFSYHKIIAIYSDSKSDHSRLSRYNYLVTKNEIKIASMNKILRIFK